MYPCLVLLLTEEIWLRFFPWISGRKAHFFLIIKLNPEGVWIALFLQAISSNRRPWFREKFHLWTNLENGSPTFVSCNHPGEIIPRTETKSWPTWPYSYVYISVTAAPPYALPFLFSLCYWSTSSVKNFLMTVPAAAGGMLYVVFPDIYFIWNKILIKLKILLWRHHVYFSSLFTHIILHQWMHPDDIFRFWQTNKKPQVSNNLGYSNILQHENFSMRKLFIYFPRRLDYLLSTSLVKPSDN